MSTIDLRVKMDNGIHWLIGELVLKRKIQHPSIQIATDVKQPYWFVRVFETRIQPGGSIKEVRAKHFLGWAEGPEKIDRRAAELARDKVLAKANGLSQPPEKAGQPPEGDYILFERLVERYKEVHEPNVTPGTWGTIESNLKCHILPYFSGMRLSQIDHHTVQVWANRLNLAKLTKQSVVARLIHIFEYAALDNLYLARNPAKKIKFGPERRFKRPKRIPTPAEARRILEILESYSPSYRLIAETALLNGMRVSEVLGLDWNRIDMQTGRFDIKQGVYRGKVTNLKNEASERRGCLLHLLAGYKELWIANGKPKDGFVFDRGDGSGMPPWYNTLRKFLKRAAAEIGFDYEGFGFHSLRRANITWRQEKQGGGATSIQTSLLAGHADVRTTLGYSEVSDAVMEGSARKTSKLWLVPDKKRKAG